ncbi:hypothetical protein [Caballeronia sp. INML2]|jgi:hypothetical protein|uniref:hypothetical protein n=1 Tax=Caballeronia sp. INML2 TaxID=2921748 RepID=UPI0020297FA4|nr:hypothetical protein [Caballeronia sp. INML2]
MADVERPKLGRRRLTRLVVELIPDKEFGRALRGDDPQFQQMVDDVTTALSDDENVNAALIKLFG